MVCSGLLGFATLLSPAALSEASGPDYFAVTGIAVGGALNVRLGPTTATTKIGQIPHGARGIQNLGCRGGPSFAEWQGMSEQQRAASADRRWCKVRYQRLVGWVSARYLREDGDEAASPAGRGNGATGNPH